MSNLKFQNALKGVSQKVPPIWMMRQAGRYHKHYQGLRAKHSFMELCKDPELASEVALGPIQDFDFDVSIMFSDLLFPLEAMGMGLEYTDQGPRLGWHLTNENLSEIKLANDSIGDLEFQREVLQLTRQKLPKDKSLIGFVGGPWTLYVYAVEGGHAGSLTKSKSQPDLFKKFSEALVPLLIKNIQLQLEGGAELVMIFDTAAGEVSPQYYSEHITPQLKKLMEMFPGKLGYYSKGTTQDHAADSVFNDTRWAGRGFDHRWNISERLKKNVGGFVQGNFDQTLLYTDTSKFKDVLLRYLEPIQKLSLEERKSWVCGLGHGVLPKTPEENVRNFVKIVREVLG